VDVSIDLESYLLNAHTKDRSRQTPDAVHLFSLVRSTLKVYFKSA